MVQRQEHGKAFIVEGEHFKCLDDDNGRVKYDSNLSILFTLVTTYAF